MTTNKSLSVIYLQFALLKSASILVTFQRALHIKMQSEKKSDIKQHAKPRSETESWKQNRPLRNFLPPSKGIAHQDSFPKKMLHNSSGSRRTTIKTQESNWKGPLRNFLWRPSKGIALHPASSKVAPCFEQSSRHREHLRFKRDPPKFRIVPFPLDCSRLAAQKLSFPASFSPLTTGRCLNAVKANGITQTRQVSANKGLPERVGAPGTYVNLVSPRSRAFPQPLLLPSFFSLSPRLLPAGASPTLSQVLSRPARRQGWILTLFPAIDFQLETYERRAPAVCLRPLCLHTRLHSTTSALRLYLATCPLAFFLLFRSLPLPPTPPNPPTDPFECSPPGETATLCSRKRVSSIGPLRENACTSESREHAENSPLA